MNIMTLQLRQKLEEIAKIVWTIPEITQDLVLAIIVPLKKETQATKMLEYLQENKNNAELMRIDNLLEVRRRIAEENQKMVLFLLIIKEIN